MSALTGIWDGSVTDLQNTNTETLGAGLTWTGTWSDMNDVCAVITSFKSSQAGTFTIQYSTDGVTADSTIGPFDLAANTNSPQSTVPTRRYYRATYTNTSGSTASLRIETRLYSSPGELTSRVEQSVSGISPAAITKSVLFGVEENGNTYTNVKVRQEGAMAVHVDDPLGAFGELLTAGLTPRVQIDALFGLLSSDHESITDGVSGSATASSSMFSCQTGTSSGGYAVIRSRRMLRYRPGQGMRMRFTGLFTTGVANSQQFAGGFSATEAVGFGYSGTSFGIWRREAGACKIVRLTVTAAAGGAETITITLNGVEFTVTTGGALATTALVAERIAENIAATGWTSVVSPTSNGSTVTFIQQTPAVADGDYLLTSDGTVTGTFATIQAGVANVTSGATVFVAQSSWNLDVMDGSGGASNPSGILLDPTKLNIYEVSIPYLGAGAIVYYVRLPGGGHQEVHRIEWPNSAIVPNMKNPTVRLGWFAASLGSTTNLTVKGASASGFTEGEILPLRDPFGTSRNGFTAETTEYVAFVIRVAGTFASTVNQREVVPLSVSVGTETSNRIVRVRLVLNPTLSGTVDWSYVNSSLSCVEVATPTALTPSGGTTVANTASATGSPTVLSLRDTGLRLQPGYTLAVCVQTATGSAVTTSAMNWNET